MPWPKTSETVVLTVNGRDYRDWESVSVKHELFGRPPYVCRFTCSEGLPLSKGFAVLQIKPGDECTCTLAGELAFTGKVMTRQVYFNSNKHHIEIICGTFSQLDTASVITKGSEFKDKTFKDIVESVLSPLGVNLKFEGGPPPDYKFPRVSVVPGENIQDFIERLSRQLGQYGNMFHTSNENGDFVVVMGKGGSADSVTEGKDLLEGRAVIYNAASSESKPAMSQGPGGDKDWGAKVASVPFAQFSSSSPFSGNAPPYLSFSEMPTSNIDLLKSRGQMESNLSKGNEVTVHATVHGWLRPSGGLWKRNQSVVVNSPMMPLQGETLRAKEVVFTQDNRSGTRTTLTLMNEIALGNSGGGVT